MKEKIISQAELERAFDERFPQAVKQRLRQARVAVAGLGGLGSNVAVMLARSGVGHLFLVDFDSVEVTNLNRQAYGVRHLGRKKTEALREILLEINPYLDITVLCERVTEDNAAQIFGAYPIVCEAFDRPENKAMLVRVLLRQTQVTVVAGSGLAGYGDCNAIRTVRRLRRLYVCGDGVTDSMAGIGLMAARVAVCAGHEANMVLRLLLEPEAAAQEYGR